MKLFIVSESEDFLHLIQGVLIRNDYPHKLNVECKVSYGLDRRSKNDKGGYGFWGSALVRQVYGSHNAKENTVQWSPYPFVKLLMIV